MAFIGLGSMPSVGNNNKSTDWFYETYENGGKK